MAYRERRLKGEVTRNRDGGMKVAPRSRNRRWVGRIVEVLARRNTCNEDEYDNRKAKSSVRDGGIKCVFTVMATFDVGSCST